MKANPNEFKPDDKAILDNRYEAIIISVSKPSELFCLIKSIEGGDEWEVMTKRLTTKK